MLKDDENFVSPLAVLFYQEYNSIQEIEETLVLNDEQIQCVVSNIDLKINKERIGFGDSQNPRLWDYADNVNTLSFLQSL